MSKVKRTIYGSAVQTALLLGLPFTMLENTTLNEKFNVQAGVAPAVGVMPKLGYFAIGNGGHRVITGADGIPYTDPIDHRATDAALFNHIPFVLREVDNDLTVTERAGYALRRQETINGVNYIAYYLKRMDLSQVNTELQHTHVIDGVSTTTPFVPGNDNLNPEHPELPSTGIITTNGNYLTASAIISILFDTINVNELINVARILYDNEQRAVISEIGACTGVDKIVTTTGPDGQFNYNEAIAVQIATHITDYFPIGSTNRGFELQIEAGATEPLLGEGVSG